MKPLSEQDHYEILEASRRADSTQIERAYRLAMATYADASLAGYSIFAEGDAAALRERIEIAYRVLSDPEARRAYDAELVRDGADAPDDADPAPAGGAREARRAPEPAGPAAQAPVSLPLDELDDESGEFDGARLRRSRLRRGVELDQIADVTKVNPLYLRFLEEERFDDLPAAVYVRGFVRAYASCLGLDGNEVAASYMRRYRPPR